MCENMRYQIKQPGWGNEGMRDEFSQGEEVINVWEWGNERARKIKSHCEGIQYLEYKDRALFGHTHKDFFISLQKAKHCKVFGSPLRRGTPQRYRFVSGYNITVLVYCTWCFFLLEQCISTLSASDFSSEDKGHWPGNGQWHLQRRGGCAWEDLVVKK